MYIPSELDSHSPVVQRVLRIRERLRQAPFLLQERDQVAAKRLGSRETTRLSWTKIDSDGNVDVTHDCTALP